VKGLVKLLPFVSLVGLVEWNGTPASLVFKPG
jgi:hypothetical protein